MRRKFLILALMLAVAINGGVFAYTWITSSVGIEAEAVEGDFATCEPAADQPEWPVDLPGDQPGEVPRGDLFYITPNSVYTGDLLVSVYLTNASALSKAYQYLNMELKLEDSVEEESQILQILTLQNGVVTFNLEPSIRVSYELSLVGGSYWTNPREPLEWEQGYSLTPEFYCEVKQR